MPRAQIHISADDPQGPWMVAEALRVEAQALGFVNLVRAWRGGPPLRRLPIARRDCETPLERALSDLLLPGESAEAVIDQYLSGRRVPSGIGVFADAWNRGQLRWLEG